VILPCGVFDGAMPELLLGPLLRHVDSRSATVWVETDGPCTVRIAGAEARTFEVAGHYYALVVITGLEPGTSTPYRVELDEATVWPPEDFPPSRIRTLPEGGDPEFVMLFGSCRKPDDPGLELDALAAYATRMRDQDEKTWPDALMLLGDQIYADETTEETKKWIAQRRSLDEGPGGEVANFEEYTHLYHESWDEPRTRWLMSTIPTSMIFDDHDVRDDWNTSQTWRDEMARTSWWDDRERGALVSYWIYQHIGNLSVDDLAQDKLFQEVVNAEGDVSELLHEFGERARQEVNGSKGTRWSYRRDFGNVRLLVIDTRSGRILSGGARSMVGDGEFEWIEENATGDFDHLLIGSSLPWLMPHAISHLQSLNEVACRQPGWRGRLGEKLRQAGDLEHWPSFRASSDRLARLVKRAAKTDTATISVLSGDVHHGYAAKVTFPEPVNAAVYQLVCSPVHNKLPWYVKPFFFLSWRRWLAALLRGRMLKKVGPQPVEWEKVGGPWLGNMIATMRANGRTAEMLMERVEGETLTRVATVPLK
jgi:phosphodiesterase/alkaline phosphatase D-like protein